MIVIKLLMWIFLLLFVKCFLIFIIFFDVCLLIIICSGKLIKLVLLNLIFVCFWWLLYNILNLVLNLVYSVFVSFCWLFFLGLIEIKCKLNGVIDLG